MAAYILEKTQHFVVSGVVGQEETEVRGTQNGSNTDEAGTTTRNDSNILPGVLGFLALTVHLVVELSDSLAEGLNASGRSVLAVVDRNVNLVRTLEASVNIIFYLRSALSEVGPGILVLEKAELSSSLGAPDNASGGAACIQSSVRQVAFVGISELTVNSRLNLYIWVS